MKQVVRSRNFGRGRRKLAACLVTLAMLFGLPQTPAAAQGGGGMPTASEQQQAAQNLLAQLAVIDGVANWDDLTIDPALGPPPWTSFVPGRDPSTIAAWIELVARTADPLETPPLAALQGDFPSIEDIEARGEYGLNDKIWSGQLVAGFGTGPGESRFARVSGNLDRAPRPDNNCSSRENDSKLARANQLTSLVGRHCTGVIGDGAFADTGDVDFYQLDSVMAGDTFAITAERAGARYFALTIGIYSSDGTLIAQFDSFLNASSFSATAPNDGTYFVAVAGIDALLADPTDPASGPGPTYVGNYQLDIDVGSAGRAAPVAAAPLPRPQDTDVFLVDLEVGDALSIGFEFEGFGGLNVGAATVYAPDRQTRQTGRWHSATRYPDESPLAHHATRNVDFIAATAGRHSIWLEAGQNNYVANLRVHPAGLADESGDDAQIIFLDFDGATVDPGIFGAPTADGERTLGNLARWLPDLGINQSDQSDVIDVIIDAVRENLEHDLKEVGGNGNRDASGIGGEFDIEILNSRDHADPWGQPNVSRILIGGSIVELSIATLGIAESIDPGNFDTTETGVVLLDLMSAPASPGDLASLNNMGFVAPSDKIDLVGRAIGTVAAHEIGHFIGNWHTDASNDVRNIMDEGGVDLALVLGLGPDRILGTADDVDVDFVTDAYSSREGFSGFENTTARSAQGLSTGQTSVGVDPTPLCNDAEVTIDMTAGDLGIGTSGNDVILGTSGNDIIDGRGGNDTICAGPGDDTIRGGGGDDQIFAGTGNDDARGGNGDDKIWGQGGDDYLAGSGGADRLYGGSGDDRAFGGNGNDTLTGFTGLDRLYGGNDDDLIEGGLDADRLVGGAGNDDLSGNGGDDVLVGNGGDDALDGGTDTDVCRGDAGTNTFIRCE